MRVTIINNREEKIKELENSPWYLASGEEWDQRPPAFQIKHTQYSERKQTKKWIAAFTSEGDQILTKFHIDKVIKYSWKWFENEGVILVPLGSLVVEWVQKGISTANLRGWVAEEGMRHVFSIDGLLDNLNAPPPPPGSFSSEIWGKILKSVVSSDLWEKWKQYAIPAKGDEYHLYLWNRGLFLVPPGQDQPTVGWSKERSKWCKVKEGIKFDGMVRISETTRIAIEKANEQGFRLAEDIVPYAWERR